MWTKYNPPRKSNYANYSKHAKVPVKIDTPRARMLNERPGQEGATVLYRDHVKGYVHFDRRLNRSIDVALPAPLYATLQRYEGIPTERVPPLIAVMRKRRDLSTTDWKRQVNDRQYCFIVLPGVRHRIYCFVQGRIAFFVEEDLVRNRMRRSHDFSSDRARELAQSEHKLLRLRWREEFEIPAQQEQS